MSGLPQERARMGKEGARLGLFCVSPSKAVIVDSKSAILVRYFGVGPRYAFVIPEVVCEKMVRVGCDGCGVITIFPERALACLSSVVLLCSLTRDELDAARNDALFGVLYEQVNVIGRNHVIQHA